MCDRSCGSAHRRDARRSPADDSAISGAANSSDQYQWELSPVTAKLAPVRVVEKVSLAE